MPAHGVTRASCGAESSACHSGMLGAQALHKAKDRHDPGAAEPWLFHLNRLIHNGEKILLSNSVRFRRDFPNSRITSMWLPQPLNRLADFYTLFELKL